MSNNHIFMALDKLPVVTFFTLIGFNSSMDFQVAGVGVVTKEILATKSAQVSFLVSVIPGVKTERLRAGKCTVTDFALVRFGPSMQIHVIF